MLSRPISRIMRMNSLFSQPLKTVVPEEKFPPKPIKAKITIIRHGQTTYNAPRKRVQGQSLGSDIVLSEQGIQEIKTKSSKKTPDLLICSPLFRCKQTASHWLDTDFDKIKCPTVLMDGLKEVDCGELVGLYVDDLPEKYKPVWQLWKRDPLKFTAFPGGESLKDFNSRVLTSFSEICRLYAHTQKEILIFCHGGPISVLNCFLGGKGLAHLWDKEVPNLAQVTLTEDQILQLQNFGPEKLENNESVDSKEETNQTPEANSCC